MKSIKYVFPIVVILIGIMACQEQDPVSPKAFNPLEKLLSFRSELVDAAIEINIISNGAAFTDQIGTIEVTGEILNKVGAPTNVDSLKVGNILIPGGGRTGYYHEVFGDDSPEEIEDVVDLYGTEIDYDVFGTYPMPTIDESFYLPEIVNFTVYSHDGEIDVTQNLTVTWNTDSNNDMVNIGLFFIPRGSSLEEAVYKIYTTEDDGSYTIPYTDLNDFPVGYTLNIAIARGHIEEVEIAENYFARMSGITYSMSEDLPIVD